MLSPAEVQSLNQRFQNESTEKILAWAWERFSARAAIGTSFQGAGLVIMHLAKQSQLHFPVFTLNTGLLFPETFALIKRLEDYFQFSIELLKPDLSVERQGEVHGPELWKHDPDLCCTMRKVLPLQNKLEELDCWITGLRREQSQSRSDTDVVEVYAFAATKDIVKLNPVAHWTRDAIWQYLKKHQIPYNPLNDQGYRSIGCWPCTAKTATGESERAGRWTGFNKVECGIHTFMEKKIDFQI